MFEIKKVFENDLTLIFKSEGEITKKNCDIWCEEMRSLIKRADKQVVFDVCSVTFRCPDAIKTLLGVIGNDVYLINCPSFVSDMLNSAGLSKNILD